MNFKIQCTNANIYEVNEIIFNKLNENDIDILLNIKSFDDMHDILEN